MADLPDKQPVPPSTSDTLTVERTVKFLWENRRLHQFRRKANQKKVKAAEKELEDAKRHIHAFTVRLDREFDAHPDVFRKMGLSRASEEDED